MWDNCVLASREINARKGDRLPHEAGLQLLSAPRAPAALPVTYTIRNSHEIEDWDLFLPGYV